ncbi:MAG: response regulator [Verrucomicrobia bacterium]|nr:response regulator [Verrucomicrobiota bacterium]
MIALVVIEGHAKLLILQKALKDAHLIERSDLKSTLELLKTTRVDLVILDAKIQEGHSLETAEKIRAAVFKETPILLITSNLKKSFYQAALRAGITDFINAPLDKNEIEQRIAVTFKNQDKPKKITQIAQRSTPRMKAQLPLTKHKFLNDQAMKEIAKARKSSTILSLLMIELDEFKKIPTSKSTAAVSHLHKVLQQNLRKNDLLIPQAPGQFILMLPRTSHRAADIIAETIRTEVLRTSFSLPLSVSIGLITLDKTTPISTPADDFNHLLEGVKRATDEAKKTGNKIVSSDAS